MKKLLCLLSVLFIALYLSACNKYDVENTYTNTLYMGNLQNFGCVTADTSNIYFVDYINNVPKLVKTDLLGTNKQILLDGYVSYINIYKDDIYFIEDTFIYKMNKKGNEKQRISDVPTNFMMIYDDILYYISKENRNLYKTDLNEKNTSILINEQIVQVYIYNDELYYIGYNHGKSSMNLKKIRIDGSSSVTISEVLDDKISKLYVNENGIYMVNEGFSSISKMDMSIGTELEIDSRFYSPPDGINQYKNYIIYYDRISNSIKYLNTNNNTISSVKHKNVYAIYFVEGTMVIYDTNQQVSFEKLHRNSGDEK